MGIGAIFIPHSVDIASHMAKLANLQNMQNLNHQKLYHHHCFHHLHHIHYLLPNREGLGITLSISHMPLFWGYFPVYLSPQGNIDWGWYLLILSFHSLGIIFVDTQTLELKNLTVSSPSSYASSTLIISWASSLSWRDFRHPDQINLTPLLDQITLPKAGAAAQCREQCF